MSQRLPLILAMFALAACRAEPAPLPDETPSPAALQVETLAGHWRVAEIDDEAPPSALYLEADDEHLWWEPRCANMVRSYKLDGTAFTAGPRRDIEPPQPGSPPPPVCTIGRPSMLTEAFAMIDGASSVVQADDGTLLFSGGGHTMELTSDTQAPSVATTELPPPPPPPADNWLVGEYRVAGVDGESIDLPHGVTLSIQPTTITFSSQCVNQRWRYRLDGETISTDAIPTEACDRGRFAQEEAMMDALDAATTVARNRANGIAFTGGGHSITIFSQ